MGTELCLCKTEKFWRWWWWWLHHAVPVLSATELGISKGQIFYYAYFTTIRKKGEWKNFTHNEAG